MGPKKSSGARRTNSGRTMSQNVAAGGPTKPASQPLPSASAGATPDAGPGLQAVGSVNQMLQGPSTPTGSSVTHQDSPEPTSSMQQDVSHEVLVRPVIQELPAVGSSPQASTALGSWGSDADGSPQQGHQPAVSDSSNAAADGPQATVTSADTSAPAQQEEAHPPPTKQDADNAGAADRHAPSGGATEASAAVSAEGEGEGEGAPQKAAEQEMAADGMPPEATTATEPAPDTAPEPEPEPEPASTAPPAPTAPTAPTAAVEPTKEQAGPPDDSGTALPAQGKKPTKASAAAHSKTGPAPPVPALKLLPPSSASISHEASDAGASDSGPAALLPPLSQRLLPAVGAGELSQQALSVLGSWHRLYCPDKEADQVAALAKHYDSKASFEDNFVQVKGLEQIAVMYYAIYRATARMDVALEKVEVLEGASPDASNGLMGGLMGRATSAGSNGHYQLRIIGRHYFYLPPLIRGPVSSLVLPKALEAWATDTLTVRAADGKVVHHQQRVHNIPTLPWVVRWPAGVVSSMALMYLLGW